jgi:hypothetical protein
LDGGLVQIGDNTYCLNNITANHTVAVTFKIQTFSITASAGANGSIDPTSAVVNYNGSQLFTATPEAGYEIVKWFLDGESIQTGGTTYTLTGVTAAHMIHVQFTGTQYEISGRITCFGLPVANVNMVGLGVITDVNGFYNTTIEDGWSGSVMPVKKGYAFEPVSRSYANVTSTQTSQNYAARLKADLDRNGNIEINDLTIMAGNWLGTAEGDINNDGIVNFLDFAELGQVW